MCRITGFWDTNNSTDYNIEEVLASMRDCMTYGGPDNGGMYFDQDHNLTFGHRRLSIIDLSDAANQPLSWNDKHLVFNGECYNYQEVKEELKDTFDFSTNSDTEVVLKAFHHWGASAMEKFRGMFAFAYWDPSIEELKLVRDRVGVKPMYWYAKDGLFMFASELKAFHHHPKFDKTIDQEAVSLYLQQGYIQAPHSIFKYVKKLEPGHILTVKKDFTIKSEKYWSAEDAYSNTTLTTKGEGELEEELSTILLDSFKLRMVADVPVGMFLSGGVDSSTVTSMLQKASNKQLKTFTIGFDNPEYNEAEHAKAVAKHIGTDHTELYCSTQDFEKIVPNIPEILDEPMGDSSIIPTHLVAKLAKEQVKVSLSADGGDEIFGGYTKYNATKFMYPKLKKIPSLGKSALAGIAGNIDPFWLEKVSGKLPVLKNHKNYGAKLPKMVNALRAKNSLEFFNSSSSYISQDLLSKIRNDKILPRISSEISIQEQRLISYLGTLDMISFMEGDILTKVDRATMQVALEGRDPMLDHKIIEFAMALPDHLKMTDADSKILLRRILYKHVPKELIERPKQGFSIPIGDWLHSLLKSELEEMQADSHFQKQFKFNETEFQKLISDFFAKKSYVNTYFIWFLYILYKWAKRWLR